MAVRFQFIRTTRLFRVARPARSEVEAHTRGDFPGEGYRAWEMQGPGRARLAK